MSIFYYFSYQSTLLLSSLSDPRSHVFSPFVRFTGDHFGVDNKENGDNFGVDLGITVQDWASFRGPNHFGSCTEPNGSLFGYSSQLPVFPERPDEIKFQELTSRLDRRQGADCLDLMTRLS